MKVLGNLLAGLGLLAVIGGLVVKFLVAPAVVQYPDDVDTTRTFEGTLNVMLNGLALAEGDLANVFIQGVPVTIDRHVQVLETDGSDALVSSVSTVLDPNQTELIRSESIYSIDRKSMEHIENFTDDERVQEREGLVVGFPIGTEERDYTGWSGDTQSTTTLTYEGTEEHPEAGEVLVFTASESPSAIVNEETLRGFPAALPKETLQALVPALGLPTEAAGQLGEVLPALPDPIPLTYVFSHDTKYWINQDTGVLVDYERSEKRSALLTVGDQQVPLADVMDLTYSMSGESTLAAIEDADEGASSISLINSLIPWGLVGGGIVAMLLGLFLRGRGKDADSKDISDRVSESAREKIEEAEDEVEEAREKIDSAKEKVKEATAEIKEDLKDEAKEAVDKD